MERSAIINHVELWKTKLGSYKQVADVCGINVGALSTILAGKYGANEQKMLQKIALKLNFKPKEWTLDRTTFDYKTIKTVVEDAQQEAMWFAISNKAGGGKTAPLEDIFNQDKTGALVYMRMEEWSARQFLAKLIERTQGERALAGKYKTIAELMDMVIGYFSELAFIKPTLMLDEFDKLKPSAKRLLIPIYNRTEGWLSVIASGTENFKKEIKAGVRIAKKGYDEIDSRFGRSYITLRGASKAEIYNICKLNGLKNEESLQQIWGELDKVNKPVKVRTSTGFKTEMIDFVEDLRRLERLIKREVLILKRQKIAA